MRRVYLYVQQHGLPREPGLQQRVVQLRHHALHSLHQLLVQRELLRAYAPGTQRCAAGAPQLVSDAQELPTQ